VQPSSGDRPADTITAGRGIGMPAITNPPRAHADFGLPVQSAAVARAPVEPILTYAILAVLIGVYVCELVFATGPTKGMDSSLQTLLALGGLSHRPVVSSDVLGFPSPQSFALGDERILPLSCWKRFGDARRQKLARGYFPRRRARRLGRVLVDQPAESPECRRLRGDHGALRRHLHAELSLRRSRQEPASIAP
jgi:hypothetical protein